MKKTYLTQDQIERLAHIFANKEQYTLHLKTLWALRRSITVSMGYPFQEIDKTSPLFNILVLTNEMIGAIDDGSICIGNDVVVVNNR